jgi:hypothetical protein
MGGVQQQTGNLLTDRFGDAQIKMPKDYWLSQPGMK